MNSFFGTIFFKMALEVVVSLDCKIRATKSTFQEEVKSP